MSGLTEFLNKSPTAFHAAETLTAELSTAGWKELSEKDEWKLEAGQGYFVSRSGRSVAAFIPGSADVSVSGIHLIASHLDSPLWKVKTEGISREAGAWRLPVEAYGAPINRTWLDRELEMAAYVILDDGRGGISGRSWRSGEAMALIPSLAIHLDRDVNKGSELNRQDHLAALMPFTDGDTAEDGPNPVLKRISEELSCPLESILASEVYLIPFSDAAEIGAGDNAWVVSGRLDNLAMAHAMLAALPSLPYTGTRGIMALWFDAEEVGSVSSAGAASLFPDEMIERVVLASGTGREKLMRCRRNSLMISADMAHSVHPNFQTKHDKAYPAVMGEGPVLKSHGLRHYATDVETEAALAVYARNADLRLQKLIVRSDVPCGYSLGPLASAAASIPTVDVGNPLWGMHSSRETASLSDHEGMIRLMREHWKA